MSFFVLFVKKYNWLDTKENDTFQCHGLLSLFLVKKPLKNNSILQYYNILSNVTCRLMIITVQVISHRRELKLSKD